MKQPSDDTTEIFGLNWHGKSEAEKEAAVSVSNEKTLKYIQTDGIFCKESTNIYIEGDNLDALKLLRADYESAVKMMYIDPPYSTGKDFVYRDKFGDGKPGLKLQDRVHSAWLNMIYPRLIAARELLAEDGVIFISIDDKELKNLSAVCDQVFGESNFVANIIWERSGGPVNLMKHFSMNHEYVLCYAKNKKKLSCKGLKRTERSVKRYINPDSDPRGVWLRSDLSVGPAVKDRVYPIKTPSGRIVMPPSGRCWQIPREKYEEYLRDNKIWFGKNGDSVPVIKRFLADVKANMTPLTIWRRTEVSTTQEAKRKLKKMFNGQAVFEYPKPVELIMRMMELYTGNNDIVMDFFSGSGTTAEAVMRQNISDGGCRRFICIQAPEKCAESTIAYQLGYPNIYEIGRERIIRAAKEIAGVLQEDGNFDGGFMVYKVHNNN